MRSPMRLSWSGWLPSVPDMERKSWDPHPTNRNASPAPVRAEVSSSLGPFLAPIHPSAWNRNSANFAFWGFCELRIDGVLGSSSPEIASWYGGARGGRVGQERPYPPSRRDRDGRDG